MYIYIHVYGAVLYTTLTCVAVKFSWDWAVYAELKVTSVCNYVLAAPVVSRHRTWLDDTS